MLGLLQVYEKEDEEPVDKLIEEIKHLIHPDKLLWAYTVATDRVKRFDGGGDSDIVLVDCGVKKSIINNILGRRFNVVLVPPKMTAKEILDVKPIAVVISNGPGDPKMCNEVIDTTKELIETKMPIFGICLGCQILALAFGGDTYKLKFGHRGQNHPCIDLDTKRCYITSQNHGFAVDEKTLGKTGLRVTAINVNDRTVEGIEHKSLPVNAVQFHPEASPGPTDANFYFDKFFKETIKK